jgi:hypothetical protein
MILRDRWRLKRGAALRDRGHRDVEEIVVKSNEEWRCSQCGKLLGLQRGQRLHIRFGRSHEYLVSAPATGVCRGCGTLNQYPSTGDRGASSAAR